MERNELASRLISGDVGAFNAIYWQHHQAIYANILKLTKDPSVARDILQEVFMTLWEKRATIKPDQPLIGWLFTISFNKSVSYLRIHLKRKLVFHNVPLNELAIPDEHTSDDDRYINLYDAINQLSPQKRRVFELCKMEGKTYQEAADEMNISRHTVKEYLSGSMAFVQDYLAVHNKPLTGVLIACLSLMAQQPGK